MSYSNVDNQVQLIGYLGNDPEPLSGGENSYTKFSVATTESYTNRNGEKVKDTTWHNIVMWGKLAEFAVNLMKKGSRVLVQGSLKSNKYTDKNGIERVSFFVKATDFRLMDKLPSDGQQQSVQNQQQRVAAQPTAAQPTAAQPTAAQPTAAQPTVAPQQQSAPQPQRSKIQATVPQPQPEPQYTNEDFDLSGDDLPF